MRKWEHHIGPGAASLLLVIVVVSMSVLGLLALNEAKNDFGLSERSMAFATAQHALSAEAEEMLAQLDGVLYACGQEAADEAQYLALVAARLPEGVQMQNRRLSWMRDTKTSRSLFCEIEIMPLGASLRCEWRAHTFITN